MNAEEIHSRIVFENQDFMVFNKPPGLCVQDEGEQKGLVRQIRESRQLNSLFICHRLDKVTSGILLLAKNPAANSAISQLFAARAVEKYYLALGGNQPKKKQGHIIGDMTKGRRKQWKLCPTRNRPAITSFYSVSLEQGLRLYLLRPFTGKTHQIRVAMKSLSTPIIGDPDYYPADEAQGTQDRCYLHAYCLRFNLFGQAYCFTLPPKEGGLFVSENAKNKIAAMSPPWEHAWREH